MNLEKVFKNLILINLAVFVIIIIGVFFEPEEITAIQYQLDSDIFNSDSNAMISLILPISILVIYPINLFLLYRLFFMYCSRLFVSLSIFMIVLA